MSEQFFKKTNYQTIAYPTALQNDQKYRLFHHFNATVK